MRRVFIAGAGLIKVEERWGEGLEFLMASAAAEAVRSTGAPRIDSIYVGSMCSETLQYQGQLGSVIAEELGLSGIPSLRVEAADASGAAAIREAFIEVASGISDIVLVVGGEKLSDGSAGEVTAALASADRFDYTGYQGATLPSLAALLYRLYLDRYGLSPEDVAQFPVIMHEHAASAPHAQYPFKITLESVLRSPPVAEPLKRLECTAAADGASSLILCSEEGLKKIPDSEGVEVAASCSATDYVTPLDREDPLHLSALAIATEKALASAGVERKSIDIVELHDSFSILAALSLESSALAQPGKSCHEARSGRYALEGDLPINTFGGLKARGHPFGATGVYQVAELYLQLTGRAGKNQVDGAKVGMAQSLAGLGGTAFTTILRVR